jgi:hypothetical protein
MTLALVGGCNRLPTQPRYELVATAQDNAYRLDTMTGAVVAIRPKGMVSVPDSNNDPLGIRDAGTPAQPALRSCSGLPNFNAQGWALMVDKNKNHAYVSPNGQQFEEVACSD